MLYRLAWVVLNLPARAFFRLRFLRAAEIPDGGVILSGNHVSYLDPVLLALHGFRPVNYMAKIELFSGRKWFARLLRSLHAFEVRRGSADRGALAEASRRVEAGRIVGIFPEGTRAAGEGLGAAFGGAAMVSLRTGAPIVPVGIHGTERALARDSRWLRRARVTIAIGEPLRPQDTPGESRREKVDTLTARLMDDIEKAVQTASEAG